MHTSSSIAVDERKHQETPPHANNPTPQGYPDRGAFPEIEEYMRYKAFDYSKLFPARIVVLPPWLSGEDDDAVTCTVTPLPLCAFLYFVRVQD
jgi:hypothetical protein